MSAARGTAPAFQLYAFDLMAKRSYRLMSLAERGLLLTMWCECWANCDIPSSADDLATLIGKPEVKHALTERVRAFFTESGDLLQSPDLEAYRAQVLEQRKRMSEGGSKGAKRRAEKQKGAKGHPSGHDSQSDQTRLEGPGSEHEIEAELGLGLGPSRKGDTVHLDQEWASAYDRASNGY